MEKIENYLSVRLAELLAQTELGSVVIDEGLQSESFAYLDISINDPKKISYIPNNRLEHFDDNHYDESMRRRYAVAGKAGKVIARLFKEPPDVTKFVSEYYAVLGKSGVVDDYEITIEDSFKYYKEEYYLNKSGSLGESCMRYDECFDDGYFDIYQDFNCKLAVLWRDNEDGERKVAARAVLWRNIDVDGVYSGGDYISAGSKVYLLDRIYTNNSSDEELLKLYALDKGWLCKAEQSYSSKTSFLFKGDDGDIHNVSLKLSVNGDITCEYYPYIDTLSYGDDYSLNNYSEDSEYCYDDTGGYRSEMNTVYSNWFDCRVYEEDAVYCDAIDDYIPSERSIWIESRHESYPDDYEYLVVTANGDNELEDDCVLFNDEYYHENDCVYSEYEGCDIPIELSSETEFGDWVLNDNLDEYLEEMEDKIKEQEEIDKQRIEYEKERRVSVSTGDNRDEVIKHMLNQLETLQDWGFDAQLATDYIKKIIKEYESNISI